MHATTKSAVPLTSGITTRSSTAVVCLNFKVPLPVRQGFKMFAARHNMTMTELLLHLVHDCLESDSRDSRKNADGVGSNM